MIGARAILLATIAGTSIANTYAIQPSLTHVAADLSVALPVISLVPTAALIGCMTGFAFLLPVADHVAPNRLVTAHLAGLVAGLVTAATAPTAVVLLAAAPLLTILGWQGTTLTALAALLLTTMITCRTRCPLPP